MIPHGKSSRYSNDGCRCIACRRAWAAYIAKRQAARAAWVAERGLPSGVEHGRSAYNNWGCRCTVCTAANSAASLRRYHARRARIARTQPEDAA